MCDANGTEITDTTHIGHINPIRYRGYYYDKELGIYYLKSRYYDPTVGRFITQDDVDYADYEAIGGLNLYAYCNNNPVMHSDPSGNSLIGTLLATIFAPLSGFIFQAAVSTLAYIGFSIAGLFHEGIRQDMELINGNVFNSDPELVRQSQYVSFYNGAPVIKHSHKSGCSFSFGMIFLNSKDNSVDTINHEWGHVAQLSTLSLGKYALGIVLPSVIGNIISNQNTKLGKWVDDNYYNLPWERSADFWLGANSGNHAKDSLEISLLYLLMLLLI